MALSTAATAAPARAARTPAAPTAAPVSASRMPARARMERSPDPRRARPASARALSRHRTRTAVVPNIPL